MRRDDLKLRDLIDSVKSQPATSPLDRLRAAASSSEELMALADRLLDHFVEAARETGCSWSEIGGVLGMTRQAAQQRFRVRWFDRFSRRGRRHMAWVGWTDRARRAVDLAQEEAGLLNHNYCGTEHILLGLLRVEEGLAAKALGRLGVSLQAVREQVEARIGRGASPIAGPVPFTPRAKKALELSLAESKDVGHNYVGTEHVLLGLLSEGQGVAAQVLAELDAGSEEARRQVVSLLSG